MLSQNTLLQIFSYLEYKELAVCEQVCQQWHYCINSDNFLISKIFNYCYVEGVRQFDWYTKKIKNIMLDQLTLIDKNGYINNLSFLKNLKHLTKLIIDVENEQIFEQILIASKEIQSVEIRMPITHIEIELLKSLPNLREVHFRIQKQRQMLKLSSFHNLYSISLQLQAIDEKEVMQMIKNSASTLRELELDAELITNEKLVELLSLLDQSIIEKIFIYYFQEYDDDIILKLSSFKNLQKLLIFQAYEISDYAMLKLVQNKDFRELYLNQCDGVTDKVLQVIANSSQNLKKIDLSWNNNISDEAVQFLLQSCKQLESVKLVGCKQLTVDCLPQNFDQIFKRMKELDLESCNKMNDKILQQLQKQFQYIKIKNYYGYGMLEL